MNETLMPVVENAPQESSQAKQTRGWTRRFEPDILIEDVIGHIPNKYLAVNVAARRARELNQQALPVSDRAKTARKPTTQALFELVDGHLRFDLLDVHNQPLPDVDADDYEVDEETAAILEEYQEDEDIIDVVDFADDEDI